MLDAGRFSVPEVAERMCKVPSTIYRWISGASEPSFPNVQLLVQALPPDCRIEIIGLLCVGSNVLVELDAEELDVNGDGEVDGRDALASIGNAVTRLGQDVVAMSGRDLAAPVTEGQYLDTTERIDKAIGDMRTAKRVIAAQYKRKSSRRKALQVGEGVGCG